MVSFSLPAITQAPDDFQLSAYQYDLPPELIAQYPLPERDASRMMVINRHTGTWQHQTIRDLPSLLRPGDLLVVNNTRVLPARLLGHRLDARTGEPHTGKVEVFFLSPEPNQPNKVWRALLRPSKKLPEGTRIIPAMGTGSVQVMQRLERGEALVAVTLPPDCSTVEQWLQTVGQMPIPPYLQRNAEPLDTDRYQTVFGKVAGSQAAPTAGLHFTPELFAALEQRGVRRAEVTLTVGLGTFQGVETDDIRHHTMHGEAFSVPNATVKAIQQTQEKGGRVVAVGTTVMKTLETAAQWQQGRITQPVEGVSNLFIYPGFQFQVVDALLTNFHLPGSTLLMLVSAFTNREIVLTAYKEAVRCRYRFYSYGDCMVLMT